MEVYRRETQKIIERFIAHRLTFFECRSALDAALVDFTRRAPQNSLASLIELISENGEIVRNEMEMRLGLVLQATSFSQLAPGPISVYEQQTIN